MADYIKREDAINIKDYLKRFGCFGDYGFVEIEGVLIALSKIPSADVAPIRRGHWIESTTYLICSACETVFNDEIAWMCRDLTYGYPMYCPYCGAKMDANSL